MTSFDLKPVLTLPPVRIARVLHWGVGGFDLFLAGVLAYGGARFTLTSGWTMVHLLDAGIGAVVVAALALAFLGSTAQAVRIAVGSDGLRLVSPTGAIKELGWRSPHAPIVIEWTESTPRQTARGLPARWQLKGYRPFSTYLTREVVEAIIRTANHLELDVREAPCPGRPGWTRISIGPA